MTSKHDSYAGLGDGSIDAEINWQTRPKQPDLPATATSNNATHTDYKAVKHSDATGSSPLLAIISETTQCGTSRLAMYPDEAFPVRPAQLDR